MAAFDSLKKLTGIDKAEQAVAGITGALNKIEGERVAKDTATKKKQADESKDARVKQKVTRAKYAGRTSTILTDPMGTQVAENTTGRKTLLGM